MVPLLFREGLNLQRLSKNLAIRVAFLKWNRVGGQLLAGLTKRRKAGAHLYSS